MNLYLDPTTKDLAVDSNFNLRLTDNIGEELSQKIENVLKTFRGEWYLDPDLGIPYFDRVFIKQADLGDVNSIFFIAVSNIDEVDEVLDFTTSLDGATRIYTVNFKVRSIDSEIISGEVVI